MSVNYKGGNRGDARAGINNAYRWRESLGARLAASVARGLRPEGDGAARAVPVARPFADAVAAELPDV